MNPKDEFNPVEKRIGFCFWVGRKELSSFQSYLRKCFCRKTDEAVYQWWRKRRGLCRKTNVLLFPC